MTERITCYERDEAPCDDGMCLRTGCRLWNDRLAATQAGAEVGLEELADWLSDHFRLDADHHMDARALLAEYRITKKGK